MAPFLVVFLVSLGLVLQFGPKDQWQIALVMCSLYGFLLGLPVLVGVAVSHIAGRYWWALSSFLCPMLFVGGVWGSLRHHKYVEGAERTDLYQQPPPLDLGEYLGYVGEASLDPGLYLGLAGLAIAVVIWFVRSKRPSA